MDGTQGAGLLVHAAPTTIAPRSIARAEWGRAGRANTLRRTAQIMDAERSNGTARALRSGAAFPRGRQAVQGRAWSFWFV